MRTRSEVIVWANGVQLCAETFGDRADPAVVLIMGSSASMEWWEDEFCELLASGGRFVIRYDLRDTGRSITYPPGSPAYTGGDLVDDLGALIDIVAPGSAHLVGMSMGGGIGQRFALDHPDRVASLTVFASTFADRDLSGLPSMSEETGRRFGAVPSPDWADRAETAAYVVELARVGAATSAHFDEAPVRSIAERAFDRSTDMEASYTNHHLLEDGAPPARRLEDLSTPTLIVHGTEDPVPPVRARNRALRDDSGGASAAARGHGPRAAPQDVGHHGPGDPAAHRRDRLGHAGLIASPSAPLPSFVACATTTPTRRSTGTTITSRR